MAIRVALAIRNEAKAGPYRQALQLGGLEAVTFAPVCGELPDSVSGLVLTGGTDVDPALYGAARQPETDQPDRERDDYETALLRAALTRDIPVLAICRGLQLFNVVQGGTLIQDLPDKRHHKPAVHEVAVDGRMTDIFGASNFRVNSRHHQAIDRVGDGIVVTAHNPEDNVIEGFVFPVARFAIGIQWHPEDMTDDPHQARMFAAFAGSLMAR